MLHKPGQVPDLEAYKILDMNERSSAGVARSSLFCLQEPSDRSFILATSLLALSLAVNKGTATQVTPLSVLSRQGR